MTFQDHLIKIPKNHSMMELDYEEVLWSLSSNGQVEGWVLI